MPLLWAPLPTEMINYLTDRGLGVFLIPFLPTCRATICRPMRFRFTFVCIVVGRYTSIIDGLRIRRVNTTWYEPVDGANATRLYRKLPALTTIFQHCTANFS